jgi:hypothetical protein
MGSIFTKILVVALIVIGEGLAIYSEMLGAKNASTQPWLQIFFKMFLIICASGALLISGYILGFGAFKNIWVVSAISITSILIIEPIVAYALFKQLPTTGGFIGFILGAIGLIITLIF